MEPVLPAHVPVAAAAPVLPLPDLAAAPLLPHLLRVVKALGVRAVVFEGKVPIVA